MTLFNEIWCQGLIFSLVVMAVFFTSRLIRFDDLTVEGSFSSGGAIASLLILHGMCDWMTLPLVVVIGAVIGLCTGILHLRFGMNPLIAGLCMTTALFSVNLKLVGSHVVLPETAFLGEFSLYYLLAIVGGIFAVLRWFLSTEPGYFIRGSGENPQMVIGLGRSPDLYKLAALAVSNGLTALAGALFVIWMGFFSISGSVGTLVVALSGLMLGSIFSRGFGLGLIIGSTLFQTLFVLTISLGLDPGWNHLIKASCMVALVLINQKKRVFNYATA